MLYVTSYYVTEIVSKERRNCDRFLNKYIQKCKMHSQSIIVSTASPHSQIVELTGKHIILYWLIENNTTNN